jgi:hypothetical protein
MTAVDEIPRYDECVKLFEFQDENSNIAFIYIPDAIPLTLALLNVIPVCAYILLRVQSQMPKCGALSRSIITKLGNAAWQDAGSFLLPCLRQRV